MDNLPLYTIAQMRAWEDAVVAAGGSYAALMENAGARAAADLLSRFSVPQRVLILCGKGNNAGDGLVMARHLAAAHWPVTVCLLLGTALSPLSHANWQCLPPTVVLPSAVDIDSLPAMDVVVDAVFGTGYSGELPPVVADCLRRFNCLPVFRVALDIPSGIDGDSGSMAANSFCADITYAFQALKPAHLRSEVQAHCGQIVCLNIE